MRTWMYGGVTFALLGVLLGLSACSGPSAPRPSSQAGSAAAGQLPARTGVGVTAPVKVTMTPSASLHGNTLTVSGSTNLPETAVIDWEVGRARAESNWDTYSSGKTVVAGGRFSFTVNVKSIPGDAIYALLVFSTNHQSEQVRATYGEHGENVAGDHARSHGDYRTVEYGLVTAR
jgi:hypothetical protein